MASLKDTFISPAVYNSLPYIKDVFKGPDECSADLADLRSLLAEHHVPDGVSVRLIHKHFDALDNEVFAFKQISAEDFGRLLVMRQRRPDATQLRGVNFFVDDDGSLQAYEYTESEVVDISSYGPFIAKFCAFVLERGLQRKFGLKLSSEWKVNTWTEFEFPCERSTLIIPKGMPVPEGDSGTGVTTEWGPSGTEDGTGDPKGHWCVNHCRNHCRAHCENHCEYHCRAHCHSHDAGASGEEWHLGGQKIEPGTPIHGLVTAVVEVW